MKKYTHAFTVLELLLALLLSGLLCSAIIGLLSTFEQLHAREITIIHANTDMRFLTKFLRRHIQEAGNASCVRTSPKPSGFIVKIEDAQQALLSFNIKIKPNSQLLQLTECVKLHDVEQYLPVLFFVAKTGRVHADGSEVDALFLKMDHHRREEFVTDVSDFQLQLHAHYVSVRYVLSSQNFRRSTPEIYWFNGVQKTAHDTASYQSGVIDAVIRNTIG